MLPGQVYVVVRCKWRIVDFYWIFLSSFGRYFSYPNSRTLPLQCHGNFFARHLSSKQLIKLSYINVFLFICLCVIFFKNGHSPTPWALSTVTYLCCTAGEIKSKTETFGQCLISYIYYFQNDTFHSPVLSDILMTPNNFKLEKSVPPVSWQFCLGLIGIRIHNSKIILQVAHPW